MLVKSDKKCSRCCDRSLRHAFVLFTCLSFAYASELDNQVDDVVDAPIQVDLGIPDVQATVGKLFSYTIPSTAFSSQSSHYILKVFNSNDEEDERLPTWLHFNEKTSSLQGIAQMKHLGNIQLTVEAFSLPHSGLNSKSETSFKIEVKKPVAVSSLSSHGIQSGVLSKLVKCKSQEAPTYISVQVDMDLDQSSALEAVNLLSSISKAIGVPRDVVRLFALPTGTSIFGTSSSTIDGGPGDAGAKKRFTNSAVLQWQVGCHGSVHNHHKVSVQKIESMSKDGQLSKMIGTPIIGWLLSKNSVFMNEDNNEKMREKRWVIEDGPIHNNYAKSTFDDENFEESEPESRIIPSMVSPTISMASASPSLNEHLHHHHHFRVKRKGRHAHAEAVIQHRFAPFEDFGGTPVMTPDIFPTRPTDGIITTVIDERMPSESPVMTSWPSGASLPVQIMSTPTIKETVTEATWTAITKPPPVIKPMKNFKPVIANRLQKLFVTSGKLFTMKIPKDTFSDFEEGDTSRLKLQLLNENMYGLAKNSWIQFEADKQMIYALPVDDDIGFHKFKLEACDSEQSCAIDEVVVRVGQHKQSRAFNHMFTAKLKFAIWKYPLDIDWRKLFVHKLASFFADQYTKAIVVKNASNKQMTISWTNDTLPLYPCPSQTIEHLFKQMSAKRKPNHPSKKFREHFKCCFDILEISVDLMKSCLDSSPRIFVGMKAPNTTGHTETTTRKVNIKPEKTNEIDIVHATVGQVLKYVIKPDTFSDDQDKFNELQLTLMDSETALIPNNSWVQFDSYNNVIYGLPFDEHVGDHEYVMKVMDTAGQTRLDSFILKVHRRPKLKPVVEFSLTLNEPFSKFDENVFHKVQVADKLAKLMGDQDTSNVSVSSIKRGSVVYTWTNVSISQQQNPSEDSIVYVVGKMFAEDKSFTDDFKNAMLPEYELKTAAFLPLGPYLGEFTPTTASKDTPVQPKKTEHATSNDDIYVTTIIPAVIIAAMLIIAAIIACILYRKRRKGKMTTQDNATFISKGIPIIFADEIDDHKNGQPANAKGKSPALLREEKPPLPPPEYPKANENMDSEDADSPLLERREPPMSQHSWGRGRPPMDDPSYDSPAPSYQPPPPFSTNSNSRQTRPKPTPTYRNPPPYVPP